MRNYLDQDQKLEILKATLRKGLGRELTPDEASFIEWIAGWDMQIYETCNGLFKDLSKKG